jgi:hypothetical protein
MLLEHGPADKTLDRAGMQGSAPLAGGEPGALGARYGRQPLESGAAFSFGAVVMLSIMRLQLSTISVICFI